MPAPPFAPPSVPALACRLASRLDVIAPLAEQVEAWCDAAGVPMAEALRINLMLDELITNIVTHGYRGRGDGWIELGLAREPGGVLLTLDDGAAAFDPTQAEADAAVDAPDIAARPIGGLGVSLVRQLAAEWRYERSDRGNRSCISRRWGGG